MRQGWLMAAVRGVSTLATAQQAKVINAELHTESASVGLAAIVNHLEQTNTPLWLGYEVAAVSGHRFSVCSGDAQSATEDGCCGVYELESSDHRFQSNDADQAAET